MCLILFAWKAHERFPLVLAANRDEFYDRPSAPTAFWEDEPDLLAGRDLRDGGTWLGITRSGRLAALTNYRDPASLKAGAPSRGALTSDYLRGRESPKAHLDRIGPAADRYNGFGLVCGNRDGLFFFSNRGGRGRVPAGVHGLSNRLLDTPWPKVEKGREALLGLLGGKDGPSPGALFEILQDRSRPPDEQLPETGVGIEWERILSPLFIESPAYGTRSSTVLLIDRDGVVTFVERVFNGRTEPRAERRFDFRIGDVLKDEG